MYNLAGPSINGKKKSYTRVQGGSDNGFFFSFVVQICDGLSSHMRHNSQAMHVRNQKFDLDLGCRCSWHSAQSVASTLTTILIYPRVYWSDH
jgi:hypothetical protein